jgi:STE24 endopeptidase
VLFDNLLADSEPRQIKLVVAHELGHRRARHVERGTLLAMAGAAAVVLLFWALLSWPALLETIGASGPGDPRVAPFLLLVVSVFELLALPLGAALSRRWEREADLSSLELTRDQEAFESAHRRLASANLADLEPPRAAYALLFSHPTPPERIAAARVWGARRRRADAPRDERDLAPPYDRPLRARPR